MASGGVPYGLIGNGTVVLNGKTIDWVGPFSDLPSRFAAARKIDLEGRFPHLVSHIHDGSIATGNPGAVDEDVNAPPSPNQLIDCRGGIVRRRNVTRKPDCVKMSVNLYIETGSKATAMILTARCSSAGNLS